MKTGFLEYVTWWGPYLIGAMAMLYAVVLRLASPGEAESDARPRWLAAIVPVVAALVVGLVLIGVLAGPRELAWRFGVVFLTGGLLALAAFAFGGWRPAASMSRGADSFFALGLAVLAMAFLRNYFREGPELYLLTAVAGAWLAAAMVAYGRPGAGLLCPRVFALAATAAAAAVSMGAYHYPGSAVGTLFAMDAWALALLLAAVASLLAGTGRRRGTTAVVAEAALLGAFWWLGAMTGQAILNDATGGWCILIGAATALIVYPLTAGAPDHWLLSGGERSILCVLALVAAAAAALKLLGGYGASLAALGSAAVLPVAALISDRLSTSAADDQLRSPSPTLLVTAALAGIALLRAFAETSAGSDAINVFSSYLIPGLALGGAVVVLPASALRDSASAQQVRPVAAAALVMLGAALTLAVGYFWRVDGLTGFLIGVVAGLFYSMVDPLLSGRHLRAELVLGIPLFAVLVMPSFLNLTMNPTREQKLISLVWILGAAALLAIATAAARWKAARRPLQQ